MKISTAKTIVSILLAVVILIITQSLAVLAGSLVSMLGIPAAIGNLISGVLYPVLAYLGVKLLCVKILKLPLEDIKLPKLSLKLFWCIAAVLMPCLVSGILLLTPGHWENNSFSIMDTLSIVTSAVFFYGIGVGIVEEMIFRGVIMSTLEYRCNKLVAILVPSVLFGLLHILGNTLDFLSTIQLIIAGTVVGILFSLVAYESGNIWNSAILHGLWNLIIVGGILHIGDAPAPSSLLNYVLETDSFLITGGDFGIEASLISILAYSVLIVLAFLFIRKKQNPAPFSK